MLPVVVTAGKFLIDHKKTVIYVVGGTILAIVGYNVISGLMEDDRKALADPTKAKPRINKIDARAIAEQLFKIMVGFTDSEDVMKVLRKLNHNEFIMVSEAFGERSYSPYGFGTEDDSWFLPNRDLRYWVNNELKSIHLKELRRTLPGIFGI